MNRNRHKSMVFVEAILIVSLCAFEGARGQGVKPPFDAPVFIGDTQAHFRGALDYDADGFMDLMSAYFSQGTVHVKGYRNTAGQPGLDWSVAYSGVVYSGAEPTSAVATGDFNADGKDDFVFTINEFFGIWLSNGAGVVPTIAWVLSEPAFIDQALAADFNGDGRPDLAFREGLELRVWLTQPAGPPVFSSSASIGSAGTFGRIFVTDANGDGAPDLGTVNGAFGLTTQVGLYLAPGGVLQPPVAYGTINDFGAEPASGDIDGDGDEDIVLFGFVQSVILRRVAPASFVVEAPVTGLPMTSLADIDQDGDLDAVGIDAVDYSTIFGLGQQAYFSIALNGGTGNFGPKSTFACSSVNRFANPDHVASAADLDHDGDVDLIAGNCVYYGRGSATNLSFGASSVGPRNLGDLDGDGDADVMPAQVNPFLFTLPSMRANAGDGSFGPTVLFAPPAPAGMVWKGPGYPGDFDGDGDIDLLVDPIPGPYVQLASVTHLLLNLGCGVFVDNGPATTGGLAIGSVLAMEPQYAFTGDFDADADVDLIVSEDSLNFGSPATAKIWWNQGAGSFSAGPVIAGIKVTHVADMNQDGSLDLVAQIVPSSLAILVWQGGNFSVPALIDTDSFAAAVGDFDSDGDRDIFSIGFTTAKLLLNAGNGTFAPPIYYPTIPPGAVQFVSTIRRAIAADVDADGLTDVVTLSPFDVSCGMALLLRNGPGGTFGSPIKQVLQPTALSDLDGDGDPDATGATFTNAFFTGRNLRFVPPSSGGRLQYGNGTAGAGGIIPILGETGPFRPGIACALRISGGLGGASGQLGVGLAPASTPLLGVTVLVTPVFVIPIQLGGPVGMAGVGSFTLPFVMPPSVGGITFFHQAGFADPAAPMGFSATNGLRIDVGF